MPILKMDRIRGFRESRIGERPCGNRGHIGQAFRFPEHRRTTVGTEVEGHPKSAVGRARMEAGVTTRDDVLLAKVGADAVGAAGSLLVGEAAAKRYSLGFAFAYVTKASAGTCGCSGLR